MATISRKLSVLVVDDDIDCRELISGIVGNDNRFDVGASCGTTRELVDILSERSFDVIVTDLMLGGTDGDHPLPVIVRHCTQNAEPVVLVVSSLSAMSITRSIPGNLRDRFAFVPKTSTLNRALITGEIDCLLSGRLGDGQRTDG